MYNSTNPQLCLPPFTIITLSDVSTATVIVKITTRARRCDVSKRRLDLSMAGAGAALVEGSAEHAALPYLPLPLTDNAHMIERERLASFLARRYHPLLELLLGHVVWDHEVRVCGCVLVMHDPVSDLTPARVCRDLLDCTL
jgi:hypothetical protein